MLTPVVQKDYYNKRNTRRRRLMLTPEPGAWYSQAGPVGPVEPENLAASVWASDVRWQWLT